MAKAAQTQAPPVMRASDYLAGYSEAVQREWLSFAQFIRSYGHVEWLMRRGWESPDA
jgi:hypothetical protein